MNSLQTDSPSTSAGSSLPAAAPSTSRTVNPASAGTAGGDAARPAAPAPAPGMRNALLVAAVMLLPIVVYFTTAMSIVSIWDSSGTFAHGYVILPISLWLIWRRRAELEALHIRPWWPGLVLLAACGAAWLLADLVDVQIVRQYAFAAMLPLTVLTVLGKRIAQAIAFPLLFILFAVPVGDSLIPPLIDLTANFTIEALRLTGIPVLRDGNSFSIPSGNWSVVDACSGLRYLISSITLGCLYAYLTYRTPWRRALFILASALVPIGANSVRAYMIVMIGHMSGMTLAVGVDHLIYGWLFFGLVMLLLFWIGSFWREDIAAQGARAGAGFAAPAGVGGFALPRTAMAGGTLAVLAAIGIWSAYAVYLNNAASGATVDLARFQPAAVQAEAFTAWTPDFPPAAARARQFYATAQQPVGIELRYYRDQTGGAKLISSTNHMGWSKNGLREVSTIQRTEMVGGRHLALSETVLTDTVGGSRLLLWHWYWIGGEMTTSNYVGKLLQLKHKLLTGSGDGAVVMVFSTYEENPEKARAALREFLQSNLARLDATLASNKRP